MSNTGKTYTEEFCRDAVELLRNSGRPISQVARELGVYVNSLHTWRNRILGQSGGESFVVPRTRNDKDRSEASAVVLLAESKQLKKKNEDLKRLREIFEKAASIFSENLELGMRRSTRCGSTNP